MRRHESYNPNSGGSSRWFSADFQIGYDPCICGKNQKWKISLWGIESFEVNLYGRSITVELPISDGEGNPNYDVDWLSSNGLRDTLSGGNQIFTKMEGLVEDYKDALDRYEQQSEAYSDYLKKKAVLDAFKGFIVDGVTGLIPAAGTFKFWFLKPKNPNTEGTNFENYIKGASKGLLGYGYDQFSMGINPKTSAPKPPDMPTASYSEMRFEGEITGTSQSEVIGPFFIPGSYNESSSLSNLTPFNYPAYNAPVGLVASLKTPESISDFESSFSSQLNAQYINSALQSQCLRWYTVNSLVDFKLRIEGGIEYILNPSLDFDMTSTETYAALEISLRRSAGLEDGSSSLQSAGINDGTNMYYSHDERTGNDFERIFLSKWTPVSDLNQMVFSLSMDEEYWFFLGGTALVTGDFSICVWNPGVVPNAQYELSSVKLKVLHDCYFDQIGSSGDQVNTTQVFSYLLFDTDAEINLIGSEGPWTTTSGYFDLYIPGTITLGNEAITTTHPLVHHVDGDEIFINA